MGVQHVKAAATVAEIPRDSDFVPVTLGQFFRITASGLQVSGDPDFETCEQLWKALKTMEKGIQFAIGDAINYFEGRFGEKAAQIVDATGYAFESARNYSWVAKRVPEENRMLDRGLSFTHHQKVAALPPKQQQKWLRRAAEDDKPWPVSRLAKEMRAADPLVEVGWYVLVTCASGEKRDQLQKRLELEGFACRPETRMGVKGDAEEKGAGS